MVTKDEIEIKYNKQDHGILEVSGRIRLMAVHNLYKDTSIEARKKAKENIEHIIMEMIYGRMVTLNLILHRDIMSSLPKEADFNLISELIRRSIPMGLTDLDRELTENQKAALPRYIHGNES